MARKRIGNRADEPRLDDASNWVTLTMVHRVLSERLIGAQGSVWATMKLTEWLQSGELRFKRKSMADPKRRQLGRAAFWRGRQIYFEDGSVGFYPPDQKRPRNHKTRVPWGYFVWKPDLDRLLPARQTAQESEPPARRKHRQPSLSPEGEQRRLRPYNRIHSELQRKLTTPKQRQVPHLKRQEAPPPRSEEARRQPNRKRRKGGGMKRILTDAQVDEGKKLYRDMLADDPRWAKRLASAVHVKKKLNLGASPRTVQRRIIDPVLNDGR